MQFPHHEDIPGANAEVTISRDSSNAFKIKIVDIASRAHVVELSMDANTFAFALTGLSSAKAMADYGNLAVVGKTRVTEPRTVDCPLTTFDKLALADWLHEHCQEDGWTIDSYLGAQNSIGLRPDGAAGRRLNYRVFKYVEA